MNLPKTRRQSTGERHRLEMKRLIIANVRFLLKSSLRIWYASSIEVRKIRIGITVAQMFKIWVGVSAHQPICKASGVDYDFVSSLLYAQKQQ